MFEFIQWFWCGLNNAVKTHAELVQFFVAFGTLSSVAVALYISTRNSRRETFERNFALLLEQHNEQLKNLLSRKDFAEKLKEVLCPDFGKGLVLSNRKMHQLDSYYGSYFRVLYYLLKHIDKNYYGYFFTHRKKKFYTSMVRSFLNSEITLLLVINVAHAKKGNQYYEYRKLVEEYSYLEHLIIDGDAFLEGSSLSVGVQLKNGLDYDENLYVTKIKILDDICKEYPASSFGDNDWKIMMEKVQNMKAEI